jgi:hypothetical protein
MSLSALTRTLRAGTGILTATLREIFDESAYQRFLTRQGREASARSYDEFLKEREAPGQRPRPRCC